MSDFEQIPEIAERIKRSKMELKENGFYWSPEWDSQSCCDQDFVNNFKKGWHSRQDEVDALQKQVGEYKRLTTSIRNEFDLWSDDSEFAGVIEAQIENLEALRGAND